MTKHGSVMNASHPNSRYVPDSAGTGGSPGLPLVDCLAVVLSEFTHTLLTDFSIDGILDHLVGRIVDILPIDSAGVTLMTPAGTARQVAGSDESVVRYEALQTELGQGPCIEAFHSRGPVSVPDLEQDGRFPEFSRRALAEGMTAVFSFPLRSDDRCLGALDLYRSTTGVLRQSDEAVAQTLADAATAYLLNAEARTAQQDLMAHVSHELRTPLSNIIGNLELLRERHGGSLSVEQGVFLDAMARSSERLRVLADGLLNLARQEWGEPAQVRDYVDLVEVVRAVAEELRPASGSSGVALGVEVPDEQVFVRGDSAGLRSLVDNLVNNALKFTAQGGWVRCSVARTGSLASVTVSDNGRGISESDQAKLFDKFFQSATGLEPPLPGSGLGLAIVDSIVRNHHGTVSVTSTPGVGSTFAVELPLAGS